MMESTSLMKQFDRQRALDRQLDQWCEVSPIIPVMTVDDLSTAIDAARALMEGGLNVLEITLRNENGLKAINAIRKALPNAIVGAGTVLDEEQLRAAVTAGSQFIVTPGANDALLDSLIKQDLPILPGVATLSEVLQGYHRGLRRFKFFPAEASGGVGALKAFSGPMADVKFCPTGGIGPNNFASYLSLENVFGVGGTWLTPKELLIERRWAEITKAVKSTLKSIGLEPS